MEHAVRSRVSDRQDAGLRLAGLLRQYAKSDSIVLGITQGGVLVASVISEELQLPLETFPCRRINHPADNTKSIGSVSPDEVIMDHEFHDIPQDYIYHQIAMTKNALRHEQDAYRQNRKNHPLRSKTVIVVDDTLRSGSTMLVSLKSIKKQQPAKIIVAVPFVSAEAAEMIGDIADEVVFIRKNHKVRKVEHDFADFPEVNEGQVQSVLRHAKTYA